MLIVENDGELALSRAHRYYTQIISQIGVTGIHSCYFIIWRLKDIFVQIVKLDEQLWSKVNANLKLFSTSFACPALLEFKPITHCGNCNTVVLEESDIEEEEEGELNSIQCDTCAAWFQYKCENITTETNTNERDCSKCLSSVINFMSIFYFWTL